MYVINGRVHCPNPINSFTGLVSIIQTYRPWTSIGKSRSLDDRDYNRTYRLFYHVIVTERNFLITVCITLTLFTVRFKTGCRFTSIKLEKMMALFRQMIPF